MALFWGNMPEAMESPSIYALWFWYW